MKADESADCAGRWGGRLPTGLCFYFFLGPRSRKMHLKNIGFRRGSDLSMLSKNPAKDFCSGDLNVRVCVCVCVCVVCKWQMARAVDDDDDGDDDD